MELSGVNRLLAFAQELGAPEVRGGPRSDAARGGATRDSDRSGPATGRLQSSDAGLKITLSPTASRLAETFAQTLPDTLRTTVNREPAFAASNTATAHNADHRIDNAGGSDRQTTSPSARRAVAAYQRNASPVHSEQIRIRA